MSNVGRENFYTCDACGAVMVTVDVDEGTTPMLTDCRADGCGGMAHSGWYAPKPEGAGLAQWEWAKPGQMDRATAGRATTLHYSLGGLELRPRRQP